MRTAVRVLAAVCAVWCLAGCATFAADPATTLIESRVDMATHAYHVAPLLVRVVPGRNGLYTPSPPVIDVGRDASPFLLAHEVSHHLLGQARNGGTTLADEVAANAEAVKVLALWGLYDEPGAASFVAAKLLHNAVTHFALAPHVWCVEYRDILHRYPAVTETSEGARTCPVTAAR